MNHDEQTLLMILGVAVLVIGLLGLPIFIVQKKHTRNRGMISVLTGCSLFIPPLWIVAIIWALGDKKDDDQEAGVKYSRYGNKID